MGKGCGSRGAPPSHCRRIHRQLLGQAPLGDPRRREVAEPSCGQHGRGHHVGLPESWLWSVIPVLRVEPQSPFSGFLASLKAAFNACLLQEALRGSPWSEGSHPPLRHAPLRLHPSWRLPTLQSLRSKSLIPQNPPGGRSCCHPHITDGATEAEEGDGTCSKPRTSMWQRVIRTPGSVTTGLGS